MSGIDGLNLLFAGGSDGVSPEVVKSDAGALRSVLYWPDGTPRGPKHLSLNATTPAPADSDILDDSNQAIVAGDLDIRDTLRHRFVIPMMKAGAERVQLGFRTVVAYDQTMIFKLYAASGILSPMSYGNAPVASLTVPASSVFWVVGTGDVGVGVTPGTSGTLVNLGYYRVPAMASSGVIVVEFQALVAPLVGGLRLNIDRG